MRVEGMGMQTRNRVHIQLASVLGMRAGMCMGTAEQSEKH